MKTFCYHREIKILITQVLNALGDLVIRQINELDEESYLDQIHVNLLYAPKQRVLFDLVNKNQHIELPVMSLAIGGINYDDARAFNKIEGFTVNHQYNLSGGNYPQPIPITLKLNLSMLARYQRHIDQMVTCIFANFYPYIVISYKHPDLGHEVRCAVIWDKSLNFEYPTDIDNTKPYRIICNSSFTVHAWMYRNAYNNSGVIYNIPTSFTAVSSLYDSYDAMHAMESPTTTDYFYISGRPQLNNVSPYQTTVSGNTDFVLYGDMLHLLSGLFVSATQGIYPVSSYQYYDLFADNPKLSAQYTGFSAVSVSNFSITNDNIMTFKLPEPLTSGYIDVIAWSDIGLGYLTEDSIRPTFNPYPSSLPEYNTYVEPQWPCISGIHIVSN